jgi:MoxR-like ATPase
MPSTQNADEQVLTITEASRIIPERGDHTDIKKIRGVISSMRPVFRMIAGEYGECPYCHTFYNNHYEKPLFEEPKFPVNVYCRNEDAIEHPVEFERDENGVYSNERGAKYDIIRDKDGKYVRTRVHLNVEYEYRNALIIELQDEDKFDDLERLQVILFDEDTKNVQAGELVTITGQIYIERLNSARDAKLGTRMYSHSIHYEARKEISISSVDRDAIRRFANKYGNRVVDKLVDMFATNVIGYQHVKRGLLISASSCANDYRSNKDFRYRIRINCLLVGDPGTAKSLLLKAVTKVVPNSRFESAQSSTGISLTALVSKEGGDVSILRCGPIPLAKEAICALNEIGRMPFESQGQLLDVMEEGEFSVNKHGINAHIRSPTVIIGSANPTTSKWRIDSTDGKVNLDDIPAIKPLVDRFDLLFVFKSSKDPIDLREYTYKKSKSESSKIPNYDEFITKYLIYAKRFNPTISDEAETILNEYYIAIARTVDSPRVRDTLFRAARMTARLKLKNVVDAEDALEVCQFYNVILNEHDQVVNIPANPRDVTLNECLCVLEATQAPITFEELIKKVCDKDEYIKTYIGEDLKVRDNKKIRTILEMMLQNSHVKRTCIKPVVLQWVPKRQDEGSSGTKDGRCDPCDLCDQQDESSIISKTPDSEGGESAVNKEGLVMESITPQVTGSHRAHRSHTDYDFELVDKSVLEIPMGLSKDWSIKRIGENGDTWLCDCPGCSDNNGGNVVTGSVGAIKGHALNHEIIEIKEELERLGDLDLGSLLEELKKCSKDTLQIFQIHVRHGSTLERFILETLDDIDKRVS